MAQIPPPFPIGTDTAVASVESYYTKRGLDYIAVVASQLPPVIPISTYTVLIDPGGPPAFYNIRPRPTLELPLFGYKTTGQVVASAVIQVLVRKESVVAFSNPDGSIATLHKFRYVALLKLTLIFASPPYILPGSPGGSSSPGPGSVFEDVFTWVADPNLVGTPGCAFPVDANAGTYGFGFCPEWVGV